MITKIKDYLTTKITPKTFFILSWTWGIIMSTIGAIVVGILVGFCKKKLQKHGLCYYVEVGKNLGGMELGYFFLCCEGSSNSLKSHEFGHALQNVVLGIFMPFVICIPSAIRYWYREFMSYINKPCKTKYDDIWFEGSATYLGTEYMKNHK